MPARAELHDRRRPQLGFDEERDVRPPVAEEAADPGRDVDRRELVDGARAASGSRRSWPGHGDRGEDDRDAGGDDAVDERQHRVGLADARRMHPGEAAGRPRPRGAAVALAEAGAIFLAARARAARATSGTSGISGKADQPVARRRAPPRRGVSRHAGRRGRRRAPVAALSASSTSRRFCSRSASSASAGTATGSATAQTARLKGRLIVALSQLPTSIRRLVA